MAEPSPTEIKQLAQIFADAYNNERGASFSWDETRSLIQEEPFDFKLFDGKKVLGVQLVRAAVADPDKVYARPEYAQRVIDRLLPKLKDANLPPLLVYINFPNPPKKQSQIDDTVFWLEQVITRSCLNKLNYFTYEKVFENTFLKDILEFVDEISIEPNPYRTQGITFITMTSKRTLEGSLDDEQRVVGAVRQKEKKYTDVILLVDAAHSPVDDIYIPQIKSSLSQSRMKEIWVVNNFLNDQRAIRVK